MDAPGTTSFSASRRYGPTPLRSLVIDSRNVKNALAPTQKPGLVAQKSDSIRQRMASGVVLALRVHLVIPETAENAGVGAKARELANRIVQRIAYLRDQVAGDDGQVRLELIQHVDRRGRVPGH